VADWIWIRNEAVNDIPGRIPADVLPAWEARGWVECPAPSDDVEVDAPASAPVAKVTPSPSGQKKENQHG
jgi:hypothetical protein